MDTSFPILLVEDDLVSRKLFESALKRSGYHVTSVENGLEALKIFKERFFPIVLTDWIMPEMDGLELTREIRSIDSEEGYVFIVLLTSKDTKDDVVQGFEAGADDYLIKPPNYSEMMARIKTGMRILELEQSLRKANEEIRILSNMDSLTGIFNRRYLSENLFNEIARSRRYKHSLSIVMCDIDHFKKINDSYGHTFGDNVLREFARCIIETIRYNVDWAVRYGGEEFLIVLPETDFIDALTMAERLRINISKTLITYNDNEVYITASFGVVGFNPETPDKFISIDAMINQVDKHLYTAKQKGRNLVRGDELKKQ